jgi:hypothetical protein
MARDIVLDVLTQAKGRGLIDAANQMDRLADKTDGTNRTLKEFSIDVEKARTRVHDLNVQFAASSGDNSGLLGDLKKAKRDLKDLERVAADVMPNIGASASQGILSGLGNLGSSLRGALIPVAIGLGVALAPTLGAVIAGVVVGGVGAGGIAGGIAAAAQDPRVKAAASVFGSEISREFAATGDLFVEPTIKALGTLEAAFRDLHLEQAFAKVAPFVDDIARGIAGFATQAMPGLNRALDAAGPALQIIGEELPQVGKAFGDMVGDISESKGAMDGLRAVFVITENTLGGLGVLVSTLGDAFHFFATAAAEVSGALEDIVTIPGLGPNSVFATLNNMLEETLGITPKVASAWEPVAGRMDDATAAAARNTGATEKNFAAAGALKMAQESAALAARAEADALDQLKKSLDGAFNAQMSLDQATLAIQRDTLAFKKAVDENGHSLSTHTEKGLANRQMLLGLVQDYERQREAASTSASATAKASAKFNDQVAALRALAEKLGFSKSQVDALLGSYGKLAKAPNINKSITIHLATTGSLAVAGNIGKIPGLASGTPAAPGGWTWVGENGPELRKLRPGDELRSNPQSMAMANGAGGGEIGVVRVIVETPDGEVLQDKLLALKRQRQLASLGF